MDYNDAMFLYSGCKHALAENLKLDRLDPGDHACDSLLDSKDTFQPFCTKDLERKISIPK